MPDWDQAGTRLRPAATEGGRGRYTVEVEPGLDLPSRDRRRFACKMPYHRHYQQRSRSQCRVGPPWFLQLILAQRFGSTTDRWPGRLRPPPSKFTLTSDSATGSVAGSL